MEKRDGRLKRNKKPVGFELSGNMCMYYAFDSHINSFLSMTTNIFLVWQTYFSFLIYAFNFENYTHMYIYTKY